MKKVMSVGRVGNRGIMVSDAVLRLRHDVTHNRWEATGISRILGSLGQVIDRIQFINITKHCDNLGIDFDKLFYLEKVDRSL